METGRIGLPIVLDEARLAGGLTEAQESCRRFAAGVERGAARVELEEEGAVRSEGMPPQWDLLTGGSDPRANVHGPTE